MCWLDEDGEATLKSGAGPGGWGALGLNVGAGQVAWVGLEVYGPPRTNDVELRVNRPQL